MKKLIPFIALAIISLCLQNCIDRNEGINMKAKAYYENDGTVMMRQDSAKSLNPEKNPPVRDGDNWRQYRTP